MEIVSVPFRFELTLDFDGYILSVISTIWDSRCSSVIVKTVAVLSDVVMELHCICMPKFVLSETSVHSFTKH